MALSVPTILTRNVALSIISDTFFFSGINIRFEHTKATGYPKQEAAVTVQFCETNGGAGGANAPLVKPSSLTYSGVANCFDATNTNQCPLNETTINAIMADVEAWWAAKNPI